MASSITNQQPAPTDWIDGKLPPPIHGTFVGGNKPPGGGFARFQHLDRRYDGKNPRKALQRRVIDYNATVTKYLQDMVYKRRRFDMDWVQPEKNFLNNVRHVGKKTVDSRVKYLPTFAREDMSMESIPTKFVHTSVNKIRCPINVLKWTPDGRRCITGATTGEFTLWNGQMFNFETILQAHESAVRAMIWSHNENWMVTSDQNGLVKYWQPNMNNVKVLPAHKEPIRGLTFSPTDAKLATCSDDSTIKIWDFNEAREERMVTGHGWDVKCVEWHPFRSLLASGSKDNLVKLWDAKSGKNLSTFHGHKNTILGLQWNKNGNWLVAGSRDQLIKLYDVRMMRELQSFKGHKREINSLIWHPHHEELFCTGGSDGAIYFWNVGDSNPVAQLESAHDSNVWTLDWHPMGHLLASGSNDHTTRFWTRHRPEDKLDDVYIIGKPEGERGMYRDHNSREDYSQKQAAARYAAAPPPPPSSFTSSYGNAPPGLNAPPPGLGVPVAPSYGGMDGGIPGLSGSAPPSSLPPGPPQRLQSQQDSYDNGYGRRGDDNYGRRDGGDRRQRRDDGQQQRYGGDRDRRRDNGGGRGGRGRGGRRGNDRDGY